VIADGNCEGITSMEDGFEIIAGSPHNLAVNMINPANSRPRGIVIMNIEFTNSGNTDVVSPILEMNSFVGAPLSFTVEGLSEGNTSLLIPLIEPNGPQNKLRPGFSGTIVVYSRATAGLGFSLTLPSY